MTHPFEQLGASNGPAATDPVYPKITLGGKLPLGTMPGRYRPTDDLLAFLDSL